MGGEREGREREREERKEAMKTTREEKRTQQGHNLVIEMKKQ